MTKATGSEKADITLTPRNKITEESYILVRRLFSIKRALITNDSILEDFMDKSIKLSTREEREFLYKRILDEYSLSLPEVHKGETRVWKIAELIKTKQKLLTKN